MSGGAEPSFFQERKIPNFLVLFEWNVVAAKGRATWCRLFPRPGARVV